MGALAATLLLQHRDTEAHQLYATRLEAIGRTQGKDSLAEAGTTTPAARLSRSNATRPSIIFVRLSALATRTLEHMLSNLSREKCSAGIHGLSSSF